MGERRRVAILGGGMGGLTAAWRLSDPSVADQVESVTVYQRGHRLGGKAASHRGVNGRIEEHGLHVWLGYYDNAFRLIRECYGELDRTRTDPESPIRTWEDAFQPAPVIGLEDFDEGNWRTWTAVFPQDDRVPGEPLGATPPTSATGLLRQSARLMASFLQSIGFGPELGHGAALAAVGEVEKAAGALRNTLPLFGGIEQLARSGRERLSPQVLAAERSRRLWQLADLVSAQLKGMVGDDLINRGFRSIDHLEYRDWIASHGASRATLDGALVRGLYDLAFSHRGGDPTDTAFPAGLGLFLATKTFFDYRGALFWKMRAGMGDVVIAPLYEALRQRGVRFEFFHRLDELVPSEDGRSIQSARLVRQIGLSGGSGSYEPLVRHDGLPCFPSVPDAHQLDLPSEAADQLAGARFESFWGRWPDAGPVHLERGRDFDELVFAIPVGMATHVAGRLAEVSDRWRTMLGTLETVGTQSFQLWLRPQERELGWPHTGSTVTSYVDSYDTWSSMTHLLEFERWPTSDRPGTVAYFCSSMRHDPIDDRMDADQPQRARQRARQAAIDYLEEDVGHYWPGALDESGRFRWELLAGAEAGAGPEAIDTQYVTANVDPSDRYVQSLPGTDHARLAPDDSDFAHLHLAGDWTDCGLNAGCIEAAVLSGIGAANSILGYRRGEGITGGFRQ